MKTFFKCGLTSLAIGLIAFGGAYAQQNNHSEEIELVDQDGQKIDAAKFKVIAQAQGEAKQLKSDVVDIQSADGKIIVIDRDGTRREIDVSDAQNIIVNKSVQSIMKNGEEQKQVTGRAIIIGPDGERQEFILGDAAGQDQAAVFVPDMDMQVEGVFDIMPRWRGNFGPGNFVFESGGSGGQFQIGVNCSPVPDQLRAHLDLSEGVGLVVAAEPGADLPAGKAGIKQHDILIFADQEELRSTKDLAAAVQVAGKEDRDMTITLVRGGKETSVEVKPVKRKLVNLGQMNGFRPGMRFRVEKVGPGFLLDDEDLDGDDVMERFETLREKIEQQFEDMKNIERDLMQRIEEGDDD